MRFKANRLKSLIATKILFLLLVLGNMSYAAHNDDDEDTISVNIKKISSQAYTLELVDGIVANNNIPRAGLLFDVEQRKIVWEKNLTKAFPIASLTKMMVGLITVEDIKAGKYNWDTEVVVTREASLMGGSRVNIKKGDKISLEELLKSAMISSGNDAAYLLAQFNAGTEANFVVRMNERAKELGMESTLFSNSTGLPAPKAILDNRSSPEDLLKLALEIIKHDELLYISGMGDAAVNINNRKTPLKNHNRLAVDFVEVEGIKTGYTRNAMFCLVATSYRCSHRLIGVALGVESSAMRNAFVADMMNNYFSHIGLGKMGEAEDAPPSLAVKYKFTDGKPEAELVKREPVVVPPTTMNNYNPNLVAPSTRPVKYHTVRKGETLNSISAKYKCSVQEVKSWNRLRSNKIVVNQKLKIYGKSQAAAPKTEMAAKPTASPEKNEIKVDASEKIDGQYYIVQKGDTLWNIAQRFDGVTVKQLMEINNIKDTKSLVPGMKLKVKSS